MITTEYEHKNRVLFLIFQLLSDKKKLNKKLRIGRASDDVKLVLNNISVPGYGHTHVHNDWKILCRTQALLRAGSLLRLALV